MTSTFGILLLCLVADSLTSRACALAVLCLARLRSEFERGL